MNMYPPFAGAVPQLRDARLNDYAIALREGTGNSRVMRAPGLEELRQGGIEGQFVGQSEGYESPPKDSASPVECKCKSFMWLHIMYMIIILILLATVIYFYLKSKQTTPKRLF
jgi:hypothetical protein